MEETVTGVRVVKGFGQEAREVATLEGRARRLFAEALECQGGVEGQTIHAFCTRLLHPFSFGAGGVATSVYLAAQYASPHWH